MRPFENEATSNMSTASHHEGNMEVMILEFVSPAPIRMRRLIFGQSLGKDHVQHHEKVRGGGGITPYIHPLRNTR